MTKQEAIQKLINWAKGEVGYLEKRSNSQLDSKTANAGTANYTKYWRDVKPEYQGEPWCACFVTDGLDKNFSKEKAAKLLKHWPFVYCPTLAELHEKHSNPEVGDIVLFYRNGTFAHTGIVTKVSGDYFNTIEGNTSDGSSIVPNGGAVCAKGYYNSSLPGTKFIRLDWSIVDDIVVPGTHYGKVYFEALKAAGIITDNTFWLDYNADINKSHAIALLDKLTGGFWYSPEDDTSIHWAQPIVISLSGKKIIENAKEWINTLDKKITKAQLLALIDKATGGMKSKYKDRKVDHWGRNHLDSLCDKAIITTPNAWTDFEATVPRAQVMALYCKAFKLV